MKNIQLFNDHFQNFKVYGIPHAQLIIADPPYNLGKNAYASNPVWYVDGDNKKGESDKAGKEFFDTDKDFRPAEFMHFCSQMLVKEPKKGLTDLDIDESGVQKDEKIGGGGRLNHKHRVWFFFALLSNCNTMWIWAQNTVLKIIFRWFSARIFPPKCLKRI